MHLKDFCFNVQEIKACVLYDHVDVKSSVKNEFLAQYIHNMITQGYAKYTPLCLSVRAVKFLP